MLVCSVSYIVPRTISAVIAEVVSASDATTTVGAVLSAALVDDPASAVDILDADIGDIMLEAASAVDTVDIASIYAATVNEAVTAADQPDATARIPRHAMLPGVFVNSDGTSREANAGSVMVNL